MALSTLLTKNLITTDLNKVIENDVKYFDENEMIASDYFNNSSS